MTIVLLIISLVFVAFGLYLIGDFMVWRGRSHVTMATIKGLQEKKDKGLKLPIVLFEDESGQEHTARTQRIDRLLFILNRPAVDDVVTVIYQAEHPDQVRVYGYINLISAAFLMSPLLVVLALKSDDVQALAQIIYAGLFGLMILGGWVLLKVIQKYY